MQSHLLDCRMRGGTARFEREARWDRIYAACKHWRGRDAELVHARPQHSLVLTLSGGTALTGNKISSAPRYEGADRPGSLSFVPAGVERRGWYRDADMRFVAVLVDPAVVADLDVDPAALRPFTNRHDRVLEVLLRDLADELVSDDEPSKLYAEHVAALALLRLARDVPRERAVLSGRALARVLDAIEARLADRLSLADLAAIANLRPALFARAFRARMRVAPYRYVIERRIERARGMLAEPRMSLAEIALALGFSSQSHFTRAFTRHTGMSPGAWRKR